MKVPVGQMALTQWATMHFIFKFKPGAHWGIFFFLFFFTVLYIYCFSECTRFSTKTINQPLVSMPHYVTCKFSLGRQNRGKNHTVCTRL